MKEHESSHIKCIQYLHAVLKNVGEISTVFVRFDKTFASFSHHKHFPFFFQPNDQNKRKILGGALYLIRFPTMDQNDLFKTVGTSRVLTAEETLDIALHLKELTPLNKLNFPDDSRIGTYQEHFFANTRCLGQPYITSGCAQQYVSFNIPKGQLSISSVFFLDVNAGPFSVHLTRNGTVHNVI